MKRIKLMATGILLPLGLILAGCASGSGGGGGPTPAAKVFDGGNIYFASGTQDNVSAKIEIANSITEIACGRTKAEAGQYGYSNGVLTLSGEFLKNIVGTGEKNIAVTTSGAKVTLNALICTKIITTGAEFQALNTDAASLSGTYILGNDIDLSDIDNFEPLGWYTEESDPNNAYFHGILEGNGHTIKNAHVYYADDISTNYNVYAENGTYKFTHEGHTAGDNIGLFQVIGSSGIVRNVNFSNIKVRGRTICGVIAGNVMGTVQNCFIDSSCSVEMGTHFYDDDCNMGGAFGIVAGTGHVSNVISKVNDLVEGARGNSTVGGVSIEKAGIYLDWDEKYKGETGNGWDHGSPNTNDNPWWKYCAVDKVNESQVNYQDSNGHLTNGIYSFVGKCWGSVQDCIGASFTVNPMDGESRTVDFGQTHLGANKPASGESNLGTLSNNQVLSFAEMKVASHYEAFDKAIWKIADGATPTLIAQYSFLA